MHESFARLTTTSLSAQLRTLVHVHVASVDQLTYEEFIRSIPTPTTLAVINMDPLKGNAVLEIAPEITFIIIDRLFGGSGDTGGKVNRDLTDIEQSVMEGIIVRIPHPVSVFQIEAADLRNGNVGILIAGQIILGAQKAVAVGLNVEHALPFPVLAGRQQPLHGGIGRTQLGVIVAGVAPPVGRFCAVVRV